MYCCSRQSWNGDNRGSPTSGARSQMQEARQVVLAASHSLSSHFDSPVEQPPSQLPWQSLPASPVGQPASQDWKQSASASFIRQTQ